MSEALESVPFTVVDTNAAQSPGLAPSLIHQFANNPRLPVIVIDNAGDEIDQALQRVRQFFPTGMFVTEGYEAEHSIDLRPSRSNHAPAPDWRINPHDNPMFGSTGIRFLYVSDGAAEGLFVPFAEGVDLVDLPTTDAELLRQDRVNPNRLQPTCYRATIGAGSLVIAREVAHRIRTTEWPRYTSVRTGGIYSAA